MCTSSLQPAAPQLPFLAKESHLHTCLFTLPRPLPLMSIQILSVDMHSNDRRSLLETDVTVTATVSGLTKDALEESLSSITGLSNLGTLSARELSSPNGAVSMYAQQLLMSALVALGVVLVSRA